MILSGVCGKGNGKRGLLWFMEVILQLTVTKEQDWLGTQNPKIGPLYAPMDPIWACSGTSGRHATRLISHIRAQPYLTPGYK